MRKRPESDYRIGERGFALLMVVVILSALLLIGVPFSISMRLQEASARNQLARTRARIAAIGALNHAIECLSRTFDCTLPGQNANNRDIYPPIVINKDTSLPFFYPEEVDVLSEMAVDFAYNGLDQHINPRSEGSTPGVAGSGALWSVNVEDEQGKININSASLPLIINLLTLMGVGDDGIVSKPADLAQDIVNHRDAAGPFHTISEVRGLLQEYDRARRNLKVLDSRLVAQLSDLHRYATVWSQREHPSLPHPVNVNTAPELVLRAVMTGVRSKLIETTFIPSESRDDNSGLAGVMSHVELLEPDASLADTSVVCVEGDDGLEFEVNIENAIGDVSTPANAPVVPYAKASLVVKRGSGGDGEELMRADIYTGAGNFVAGDRFDFTTLTLDKVRGGALLDNVIRRLTAELDVQVNAVAGGSGDLTLLDYGADDAAERTFSVGGWVEMRGLLGEPPEGEESRICSAVMRCAAVSGNVLTVDLAPEIVGEMIRAKVRPFVIGLGRGPGELGGILAAAKVPGCGEPDATARPEQINSIIMNACKPQSRHLYDATTGFCTKSYGVFTIDAVGIVSDAGGNEMARHHVREVVRLQPPRTDEGGIAEQTWTLDTQYEGEKFVVTPATSSLVTAGGTAITHDRAPSSARASLFVKPSDGRLQPNQGTRFALNYDTCLASALLCDRGNTGMPPLAVPCGGQLPGNIRAYFTQNGRLNDIDYGGVQMFELWFKPNPPEFTDGGDHYLFDSANIEGPDFEDRQLQNRISLFYRGNPGELVFRIADGTLEERAAEIHHPWAPAETPNWHHLMVQWDGIHHNEMAMFLDGLKVGQYSPIMDRLGEVMAAGCTLIVPSFNQPVDYRDTQPQDDYANATPLIWGYVSEFDRAVNFGANPAPDDLSQWGTGMLAGSLAAPPADPAALTMPVIDTDAGEQMPQGYSEDGMNAANAQIIIISDITEFQHSGFARISHSTVGDVLIHYGTIGETQTAAAQPCLRNIEFGSFSGFSGEWTSETSSKVYPYDATKVYPISIQLDRIDSYPIHLYDPFGYFSRYQSGNLWTGRHYVAVGDEWIRYTHKQVYHRGRYLIDTTAGRGMRGAAGTEPSAHNGGSSVLCVYEVDARAHPGRGDAVTIYDDTGARCEAEIRRSFRESYYNVYVSFIERFSASVSLKANARMAKFPFLEFSLPETMTIGANWFLDAAAAADFDDFVYNVSDCGSSRAGIAIPEASAVDPIPLYHPERLYDISHSEPWRYLSHVHYLPTEGFALIDDEVVYFRSLSHGKPTSGGSGLVGKHEQLTYPETALAAGEAVIAEGTGSFVWRVADGEDDPITAGFNPSGGYLEVSSWTSLTISGGYVDWLIESGYLANRPGDPDAEGNYPFDGTEARTGAQQRLEIIRYSDINPKEPGPGPFTFTIAERGLWGRGEPAGGHVYTEYTDSEDEVKRLPPKIRAIAEVQLIRRGLLGTTPAPHARGAVFMPLPWPNTSLVTSVAQRDGELDRIHLTDTADFPASGYVRIGDGGDSEIIGYTGIGRDGLGQYIHGCRYFRARFGTTRQGGIDSLEPIDLNDPAADFSDSVFRIATLFVPKYHDRRPALASGAMPVKANPADPFIADRDMCFYQVSKDVAGAKWRRINWLMEPPEGISAADCAEVHVRIDGSPDWGTPPVDWNHADAANGNCIYRFTDPDGENLIRRVDKDNFGEFGDRIEIRVYFKNFSNVDADGAVRQWKRPVLRGIEVGYLANTLVLNHEELDY